LGASQNFGLAVLLGIAPLTFKRVVTGAEVPFDNSVTGNFTVYQDQLENNLCSYSPTQKFGMFFYSCAALHHLAILFNNTKFFLRSTLLLNRNKHNW